MFNGYIKYPLGNEAIDYINGLPIVPNFLVDSVTKACNWSSGLLYTLLPPDIPQSQVNTPQWGGVIPGGKKHRVIHKDGSASIISKKMNNHHLIKDIVKDHLISKPGALVLFSADVVGPEDVVPQHWKFSFYRNEVYYDIIMDDLESEYRVKKLRYYLEVMAVFSSGLDVSKFVGVMKKELSLYELKSIIQAINKVIFTAYDQESFIVWEKGSST